MSWRKQRSVPGGGAGWVGEGGGVSRQKVEMALE